MIQNKIESTPENWENGTLGNDPEFLEQAGPEVEAALDAALELSTEVICQGYILSSEQ